MKKNTLGKQIAQLRKELGMTQQTLAQQMGVTDKAVSKWERDLSCPDVATLPKLAQTLGVTVDELMQPGARKEPAPSGRVQEILDLVLKAVPLAMGIAVAVLTVLGEMEVMPALTMLGIGMACLAIRNFQS